MPTWHFQEHRGVALGGSKVRPRTLPHILVSVSQFSEALPAAVSHTHVNKISSFSYNFFILKHTRAAQNVSSFFFEFLIFSNFFYA